MLPEETQRSKAEGFLKETDGLSVETFIEMMRKDDIEVTNKSDKDNQLKKLGTLSSLLQQLHQVSGLGERLPFHMCSVCASLSQNTTHKMHN